MSNKIDAMDMDQETEQELMPRLRFPEFRDAPEWEEKKLSEVCNINPSTGGLPESFFYIDLESVVAGKLIYRKKISRNDAPSRAQRLLRNGDVIYQIVRPYQRNNFFCDFDDENNYVASTGYAQLRSFGASGFLYQLIHTDAFVNKVIAKCTGSNYPAINSSDLAEISVAIPRVPEQQKIADCLSSIDDLITAQTQKLDTLKTHKKGLLQQLFPTEGETLPKLRFPEFQDAPEWEENLLEKYFTPIRNGFVGTATPYYVPNGVPYLQGKNIKQGQIDANDLITISEDFHRKQQKSHLRINDILMVQSGHVGECALVDQKFVGGNCHALIIMSPKENVHSAFFVHYFYSPHGKNGIDQIKTGNTIEHILTSDLKSVMVCVPSFNEQQKIADCLASIDDQIAVQSQKLDMLKTHKKGLMQQLFPSPDEVPG